MLEELKPNLYEGITTTEIKDMVCKILENRAKKLAEAYERYSQDKLKVNCGDDVEIWTEAQISGMLKDIRQKREFGGEELRFLAHKIVRDIKKITLLPTKSLVDRL